MEINIIAVGKIKENYLVDAINEYKKRLKKFCDMNIIEISEYKINIENNSYVEIAKQNEGEKILDILENKNGYNIAMAIDGKMFDSEEFSKNLNEIKLYRKKNINFIVGGSYGLSDEVIKKADIKISFSKMTFPHQLFRLLLLEQIYRAFKIEYNEPYHK